MGILTDTKTNHRRNIRALKRAGAGMRAATVITDKRIMVRRPMVSSTMTTLTKQSTTMMKINMMILRTMVKAIPISTKRTLILEIKVLRITQLKGTDLGKTTMIESNRKEVEDMMEEIEEVDRLEEGAEVIREVGVVAMIVTLEVVEEATMEAMLSTMIEKSKKKM